MALNRLCKYGLNLRGRYTLKSGSFSAIPTISKDSRRWNSDNGSTPFYGNPRSASDPSFFRKGKVSNLSLTERLAVTVHSAFTALSDPERGDAVAALGEITGHVALTDMYDRMMQDPIGQRILSEKPIVDRQKIDLEMLANLKSKNENAITFGQAYASFMADHGFDPNERSQIKYISDPELAYIMLRHRQCHDFWHTLYGLPPTVLGELALKWVELFQTGLTVAALSATVGSLRLSNEERAFLMDVYLPWAVRVGKNSKFLLNIYYEEEFETDLDVLREKIGIEKAPVYDIKQ